jgi:hypothetical protein
MLLLLPSECYRPLMRRARPNSLALKALDQANPTENRGPMTRAEFAIVCDADTAQELLKIATDYCPEAVPIIQEGIQSFKNR